MGKIKKNKLKNVNDEIADIGSKVNKIKKAKLKKIKTKTTENVPKEDTENIIELPPVRRSDEIPLSLVSFIVLSCFF